MTAENIVYKNNVGISTEEFIDVLKRSTLDARRPVTDKARIQRMLDKADILVTAWSGTNLVGVSRALSDFAFCCYLSDLAVDVDFQKMGIGKRLIDETRKTAGEQTTLILLAAPAAALYYPKIGMENFTDCFLIREKTQ